MDISVFGLGKLGAPLAAVLGAKGHTVIGCDINQEFVQRINDGKAPVEEPRLEEMVNAGKGRLSAVVDPEAAVLGSDVTFIIVPTPSTSAGIFTNKYVLNAVKDIGKALQKKDTYHLVVVTSTVMPGSTDGEIRETLERASGRTVGDNLGLCYNPEFIALGSVIRDMLQPDMILIGESDPRAGDLLEKIHQSVCENDPPRQRMNLVNAEITKISVNTYVTTKISYANMLADMCDRIAGSDVDVVTSALGMDTRIGGKYLKGALGYGGPCFPRDNVAFSKLARSIGARADLAEATDGINDYQIERLARVVNARLQPGGTVAVLGMSYKPDTDVIEESQGLELAKRLSEAGYKVLIHDPMAMESAKAVLGNLVSANDSLAACAGQADMLVLTTPWPEFRELKPEWFRNRIRPCVVVDCWRILPAEKFTEGVEIVQLGKGEQAGGKISGETAKTAVN